MGLNEWPAPGTSRSARITRRAFLGYGAAAGAVVGLESLLPRYALATERYPRLEPGVLDGRDGPIELTISESPVPFGDRQGSATTINGTVPGPLLRFREGNEAVIRVTNRLSEDTSIHWHGLLVPNGMDGVPKVNFPGIRPGETFEYRYPIAQYGTYWYHSHSGLQEQLGHYGPLVLDPAEPEPFEYERDYVVVLSDWTFENPYRVLARLKKKPDYYNFQKRTVGDFFRDVGDQGFFAALGNRLMWGEMRMNPTDIADITGATYTYLLNGRAPEDGWTGLFQPGERVRLRFINAAAASYFDVRIPGLELEVVQVSGQHVRPVVTDEFRIATAETYDVIVRPREDRAFTVYAEAMDRSGFARGTLAPREGMEAPIPERRPRPILSMADMGMDHGDADHAGMGHGAADTASGATADPGHAGMGHGAQPDTATSEGGAGAHAGHRSDPVSAAATPDSGHAGHAMPPAAGPIGSAESSLRPAGSVPEDQPHGDDDHGPANAAVPETLRSRLHEPGVGLGGDGRRVLTYAQLQSLHANRDLQPPDREIELHLTGNMERFMWSIDGKKFSDAEPIRVQLGERIRLTMVNDTMMNHPMHLHGMWMELENGHGDAIPRVHTVNVQPAERVSLLFTADALGPWAFHCHILYHMEVGMFRVVLVTDEPVAAEAP